MVNQKSTYSVILIENNPLDSAVIDSIFKNESRFRLRYTAAPLSESKTVRAITLDNLTTIIETKQEDYFPDIVLFDLALTDSCAKILSQKEFYEKIFDLRSLGIKLASVKGAFEKSVLAELAISFSNILQNKLTQLTTNHETKFKTFIDKTSDQTMKKWCNLAIDNKIQLQEIANNFFSEVFEYDGLTAKELSKVPSLFRIFAIIASYPMICFGIVSHFATRDSMKILTSILGCRFPANEEIREKVFSSLVTYKGNLLDVVTRERYCDKLYRGYQIWKIYSNSKYYLAPFNNIPLHNISLAEDSSPISFESVMNEIKNEFESDKADKQLAVIWDKYGILINGWMKNIGSLNDLPEDTCAMSIQWREPLKLIQKEDFFKIETIRKNIFFVDSPLNCSEEELFDRLNHLSDSLKTNKEYHGIIILSGTIELYETFINKCQNDTIPFYPYTISDFDSSMNILIYNHPIFNINDKCIASSMQDISKKLSKKSLSTFKLFGDYLVEKIHPEYFGSINEMSIQDSKQQFNMLANKSFSFRWRNIPKKRKKHFRFISSLIKNETIHHFINKINRKNDLTKPYVKIEFWDELRNELNNIIEKIEAEKNPNFNIIKEIMNPEEKITIIGSSQKKEV